MALTLIGRKVRGSQGCGEHRVTELDIRDVRIRHGFPVTSPARTLIDCAAGGLAIDRLLNEARVLKLVKDAEIQRAMGRCPGRKGDEAAPRAARGRAGLGVHAFGGRAHSEGDRPKESGIERPIFNTYVKGVEVDAYWPRWQPGDRG